MPKHPNTPKQPIPDPTTSPGNEAWARVELFRWQYGTLPEPTDYRPLHVPTALHKMADAFNDKDHAKWPAPSNVVSILRYAAAIIERGGEEFAPQDQPPD